VDVSGKDITESGIAVSSNYPAGEVIEPIELGPVGMQRLRTRLEAGEHELRKRICSQIKGATGGSVSFRTNVKGHEDGSAEFTCPDNHGMQR
jgi:hypothetical protein